MKQVFCGLVLLFFANLSITGQIAVRPQVGINFADFNYESIHGSIKGKTGFHFGADVQLGKTYYIQPGVFYSATKLQISGFGDIEVSRLDIPVMVGYKIVDNEDGTIGLRVFAGPNFAFKLNETISSTITDISRDDFKDFVASGIVGAGLDVSMVFVDFGYKFGLSKYIESDRADANVNYFIGNVGVRLGF